MFRSSTLILRKSYSCKAVFTQTNPAKMSPANQFVALSGRASHVPELLTRSEWARGQA